MVVVLTFVELINGLAAFKMVAAQNPRLLELGEYTVDRGQTDVGVVMQQVSKNIFGRHVPLRAALENLQDFQTGQGGFEAVVFEFVDLAHGGVRGVWQTDRNLKLPLQCPDHIGPTSTMTAPLNFRALRVWLAGLVLGASLVGCGNIHRDTFRPYVPEVVQGNFVSKEQRQALRPGMVRAQVRDILGTPLVASLFHADRWDYAFSIQRQGVAPQHFRLTLLFKGDVLEQIESDILPSEAEFAGRLVTPRQTGKTPKLEATEEDLRKFPAGKSNADAPRPVPAPLPSSYPPLEPAVR